MKYTGKMIKLGSSLGIIIPKPLVKKLKMYRGQVMVIKLRRGKLDITALDNYMDKKDKGDNDEQS